MLCRGRWPENGTLYMPNSCFWIRLSAVVVLVLARPFTCSAEPQCRYEETNAPLPAPYDRHSWVKYLEPTHHRKVPDWIHKLISSAYPDKVRPRGRQPKFHLCYRASSSPLVSQKSLCSMK